MSPLKKVNRSKVGKSKGSRAEKLTASKTKTRSRKKTETVNLQESKSENVSTFKSETQKPSATGSNLSTNILRVVAVLAVIGITVYIYSIRDRVEEFTQYGYFGVFFVMLLANATVFLPAPGIAIVFAMGSVFNPLGVAFAAGAGGAIGELTGYLAGFGGQGLVENTKIYNRIFPWVKKYGARMIFVLAAFPNPFFDTAGVAAGIVKIPFWQFLLACWAGQTIKMAMFAYAGAYSIDWLTNFFD